ncbi:MAG: plasmid replication, integration and excision activator, partial [Streptosporangiaceae bacterium]
MAVQGPIPVEFATVFPRGVFAVGPFEAVRDFEASKGGQFVQSRDKTTGLPLWVADVIDGDPEART